MRLLLAALLIVPAPGFALSEAAREFMELTRQLEPVQCERRKLRREITLAQAENRTADAQALRSRFSALGREAKTARLEKRLRELGPIVEKSPDPEDLKSVYEQQREAYYRCD